MTHCFLELRLNTDETESQKLPAMVLCLGASPRKFLFCLHFVVDVLHFIVICWFSSFTFPGYFAMSLALHPGFSDPWRPPPALSSTPTTFDCLCFFIYCERYGFEWAFFTHRRFLPYAPLTCVYQASLGAGSYSSSLQGFILILETQTRPIYLFDSQ